MQKFDAPPARATEVVGAAAPAKADSRVQRTRDRVLTASLVLLSENGVGGFSVDEIARRSGVAKTTIYRHWATREALVLDACAQLSADEEVPDTGSLVGDVTAVLTNIAELLRTAGWSTVVPSIIDVAERDPDFAEVHSRIQRGHAGPLAAVLDRAVLRRELAGATDCPAMVAALLGPLFYRRWFSREPLDERFVAAIVAGVIHTGRESANDADE